VRVYHKPFVELIWVGWLLMALGGLLAFFDRRYRITVGVKHRAPSSAPRLLEAGTAAAG